MHISTLITQQTNPATARETANKPITQNYFWINFKEQEKKYPKQMKLWIKFNNGREQTYADISFLHSICQMYFEKEPIICSLKHVWDNYHKIIDNKRITEPWRIARIYPGNSKGPDDYFVQYNQDGEPRYNNKDGIEIPALRLNWDSELIQNYESKLHLEMKVFLMQLKNDHLIKA